MTSPTGKFINRKYVSSCLSVQGIRLFNRFNLNN